MQPKLTVHETPTEQLITKAAAEVTVKDSAGRTITLKKPGILAQFHIVEIAGDSAKNSVYMNMILPFIYVTAIDGEPVYEPTNKLQLEAIIKRLDHHGLDAAVKGIVDTWGENDAEADKAAVKKIATSTPIREALWLVRNGVDFDLAFQLDDATRAAYCIIFSEQEGRKFDWSTMRFKERD